MYDPHHPYASEVDCEEPNVEQEPEPESRSINDICTKHRVALEKLTVSQDVDVGHLEGGWIGD